MQLGIDNSENTFEQTGNWKSRLSTNEADAIAESVIKALNADPKFKPWYCKLIYTFGPIQVADWVKRVSDGKDPKRLFSRIAADALRARENKGRQNG